MIYFNVDLFHPSVVDSDYFSDPIFVRRETNMSFQAISNNALNEGTLYVQWSNDESNPQHWSNLITIPISGIALLDYQNIKVCYEWVRGKFVSNVRGSQSIRTVGDITTDTFYLLAEDGAILNAENSDKLRRE